MLTQVKDREVEWTTWEPELHATLMFVIKGDEVLLIEKLTGIIPSIHCHVYVAHEYSGEPTATREANPFWCEKKNIPYEKMWADDAYWLPQMLDSQQFNGRFIFEKEEILWSDVQFGDSGHSLWRNYSVRS